MMVIHIHNHHEAGFDVNNKELESIKARVREIEEEGEKLKLLQSEVDLKMNFGSFPSTSSTPFNNDNSSLKSSGGVSLEVKMEEDGRSVYVGNVDYEASAEELEQHFHECGTIYRVTILCNKYNGRPKGFAYIEFADKDSVDTALGMDQSLFKARQIKVMPKRTNRPGLGRADRPPRGRFRGGRFSGRRGRSRFPRSGGAFRSSRRGYNFWPY